MHMPPNWDSEPEPGVPCSWSDAALTRACTASSALGQVVNRVGRLREHRRAWFYCVSDARLAPAAPGGDCRLAGVHGRPSLQVLDARSAEA